MSVYLWTQSVLPPAITPNSLNKNWPKFVQIESDLTGPLAAYMYSSETRNTYRVLVTNLILWHEK